MMLDVAVVKFTIGDSPTQKVGLFFARRDTILCVSNFDDVGRPSEDFPLCFLSS